MNGYEFTEYTANMYFDGNTWSNISVVSHAKAPTSFMNTGPFFGVSVTQCIRITHDNDGNTVLFGAAQSIARLRLKAEERLLPMPDDEKLLEAVCMLTDGERHRMYDGGRLFARIILYGNDRSPTPYPVSCCGANIALLYVAGESTLEQLRTYADSAQFADFALKGELARRNGYDDAVILDSTYRKYILGLSDKSIFFRTENAVITPLLPNFHCDVMRDFVIELMQSWEIDTQIRRISTDELLSLYQSGGLCEAFATDIFGTVFAITETVADGKRAMLEKGKLTKKLFDAVKNTELGTYPAPTGWIQRI